MAEKSQECWQCRLTGGGGLLGMGAYVVHQSKKVKTSSRTTIATIGYAIAGVGFLKLFALPPFRSRAINEDKNKIEESEENEYIIGKIPPKFQ